MAKEYVKLWDSYAAYFEPLSDAEVGRLVLGMLKYKSTGTAPEFSGNERFVWPAIRRDIDVAIEAQQALSATRSNAGKQGGRPKTKSTDEKANESKCFQGKAKKAMDKVKDMDKDNIAATAATARERCGMDAVPPQSPPEDPGLAQAAQCYEANIGPLPRFVGDRLQFWLAELGPDLVCEAIHRAAAANARSWNYAEKILRDWQGAGVRTVDAARMERAARQRPAAPHSQGAPGNRRETADEVWRKIAEGGDGNDQAGGSGFAAIDGEILAELPPGR